MSVRFRCHCGAILVADDAHIDSIKPCPNCHISMRVPQQPPPTRACVMCSHTIPAAHTIWVRGRRVCWQCMPPGTVRLDLTAFREHRRLQLDTIRKAKLQGLHHFQYHAPFEGQHSEVQLAADELVLEEKDWDRVTPAWRDLGLMPFDMGGFMAVGLTVERFRAQAEESKRSLDPLLSLVKLADELPLASRPKTAPGPGQNAPASPSAS